MNYKLISKIVRWILSGLLLIGIYSETGIFTALFAFLVLGASELYAYKVGD